LILLVQRIKNFVVHIISLHYFQKIWMHTCIVCLIPFNRFLIPLRIHGKTSHYHFLITLSHYNRSLLQNIVSFIVLFCKRDMFLGSLLIVASPYHCLITLSHYNCLIAIEITLNISAGHIFDVYAYIHVAKAGSALQESWQLRISHITCE